MMLQHHLVITKLKQQSVPGNLTILITNFLQNRQQRALLKSHNKYSAVVTSNVGVPQGTLLLAFVVSQQFDNGKAIKYADDTTSYFPLPKRSASSTKPLCVNFEPPSTGQTIIDNCSDWSKQNRMILNDAKTKVMNTSSLKRTKDELITDNKRNPASRLSKEYATIGCVH